MIVGHNTSVISTLATAGVLATFVGDQLSGFEREVLARVCERFIALGPETEIADADWQVIRDAAKAMARRAQPAWMVHYELNQDGRGVPSLKRYGAS